MSEETKSLEQRKVEALEGIRASMLIIAVISSCLGTATLLNLWFD